MNPIKSALWLFGLAPASQMDRLKERAEKTDQRAGELKEALSAARQEMERWKDKAGELSKRAAKTDDAVERLAKAERELQQWKARDEKHLGQLHDVRERMERAEHAVALSREHLMATETKLDIIEGAIGVLDTRTRRALDAHSPPDSSKSEPSQLPTPDARLPAKSR